MIARTLFKSEHEQFRDQARKFFEHELAPSHPEWEESGRIPREIWTKLGEAGFLCPTVPEAYGGAGADKLYSVVIAEELCSLGLLGPALSFAMHSEIVAPYILHYGTTTQKEVWLPRMASGEMVGALAMSEPGGGSDLQALRTTAAREGDTYIVSGQKVFISNGQNADLIIVACKTDPELRAKGISLIVVEATRNGFARGRNLNKIGLKSSDTSELFFDAVRVPVANLLGDEGQGFAMMMRELPWERLQIAVAAVAAAAGVLQATIRYTKEREAFGQRVADFQNTRFKLAEMSAEIEIARVFADRCIELALNRELDVATAAMAKYWTTDLQCKVVDQCVQLHGGYGYMSDFAVARAYIDARAQRIYGGTNEIMKELIARTL
ncbi:MAG: acyl-CoA dehydrogenase family protein [Thermomicrobiales bacterium]|uniref:acyl-CoA dehydrogenase family protein n=1 Tax=Pseudorhodoplanes sp. TaxID=1934341 RepID=UPI003D147869